MKIDIVLRARSLQAKNLLVNSFPERIIFTLPIIHQCMTIVCGLPLGIAVVPREIDDSGYAFFFLMGVMEGAQGKQGACGMSKLRIRETQVNVSY